VYVHTERCEARIERERSFGSCTYDIMLSFPVYL